MAKYYIITYQKTYKEKMEIKNGLRYFFKLDKPEIIKNTKIIKSVSKEQAVKNLKKYNIRGVEILNIEEVK